MRAKEEEISGMDIDSESARSWLCMQVGISATVTPAVAARIAPACGNELNAEESVP